MYNIIFEDIYGMSSGVGTANDLKDLENCIKFVQENLLQKGLKGTITVKKDDGNLAFTALIDEAIEAQRAYEEMLEEDNDADENYYN